MVWRVAVWRLAVQRAPCSSIAAAIFSAPADIGNVNGFGCSTFLGGTDQVVTGGEVRHTGLE